ncbi:MAG: hydroxymethylbilane synthase [Polyangiales bacterium]
MRIRIATRKSALALTQTRWVAAQIRAHRPDVTVEEVHVVTEGDRILDRPLADIGGKGLFVSEVEATLSRGEADLAVHSMKDVPGELAEGLGIVCIPVREDPRDVILTRTGEVFDGLVAGSKVGTSSLRRMAQLRALRPDLQYLPVRGNVDTRIRKLEEGQFEAIVLAYAGLRRLGLDERALEALAVDVSIPAVGQGALAIEARLGDADTLAALAPLEHEPTRIAVEAERVFLRKLEGNCKSPIAGHARFADDGARLVMDGMVASIDGERVLTTSVSRFLEARTRDARVREAADVALEVADNLIAHGADKLIQGALVSSEHAKRSLN